MPLFTSVTVTVAFGITAPVESVTVPTMEPKTACAFTGNGKTNKPRIDRKMMKDERERTTGIPLLKKGADAHHCAFMRNASGQRGENGARCTIRNCFRLYSAYLRIRCA